MPANQHDQLVEIGARWLKRQGFQLVTTELRAVGSREQPDVIGFRASCSAIIEAKASRSDFLADAKKPERRDPSAGLGTYRFYLAAPSVIAPDDLPHGWGLLHTDGGRIREIVRPKGNLWPGLGTTLTEWQPFQHPSNMERERAILFSIARRKSAVAR